MSFIVGFLLKPFFFRASVKPASYPVSWHDATVTERPAVQAAETMEEHHKRMLRVRSLGVSSEICLSALSPELLSKVGIGNIKAAV